MKNRIFVSLILAIALGSGGVAWSQVDYTPSTAAITWYNGYLGQRTSTDIVATVSVTYDGSGGFTMSVNMTGSVAGYPYNWTGTCSDGTIVSGSASCTINWSGTVSGTPLGTLTATNNGGSYSGYATGASGTEFADADELILEAFSAGTLSPALPGAEGGAWNHLTNAPGTKVTFFNYPEVKDWSLY